MTILSDKSIVDLVKRGEIIIEPFDKAKLTPNGYDLTIEEIEIPGNHKIWHLALENNDEYMNYGIYANGLLVESCSKRMMREFSGFSYKTQLGHAKTSAWNS